ncbi:MAG: succinyl-diaminopimelate desuccinylase [Rhodobacteraceae bacterium]|nr:succinyl-diaminopimelate desuccinylase [Paracoccaceae bacterium]
METPDPVALTQALIQCPSVTPEEGGAIRLVAEALTPFGFECRRVDRGGIANLYAKWSGGDGPCFGFNGHTDVVPIGDRAAWSRGPFGGELVDGVIWGRGATDMKSGVAAFISAACRFVTATPPQGSVVLMITGDEEGDGVDGTRALLDWMDESGERVDHCLVGEPTSVSTLGDVMKIGRRGSMTANFTAKGKQGHTAYPHRARNPLPALVKLLDGFASAALDDGYPHFEPSTLALTTVDVGNPANNVIPGIARAQLNIRFNPTHTGAALTAWLKDAAARMSQETGVEIEMQSRISGEAFLTEPGSFTELVAKAVATSTGRQPQLTTGGGTSDARFMKAHCPVVEFGLVGDTMHQVDERVPANDVAALSTAYEAILTRYFQQA